MAGTLADGSQVNDDPAKINRLESEFRKVLELAPVDDYAHYALGRCLEKQGRTSEANGHYKLASSLRPGRPAYEARIKES